MQLSYLFQREIQESNELFSKTAELVDAIHEYPSVQSYRTKFALKYFLSEAIPYFCWLIALIAVCIVRSTNDDQTSFYFGQSLQGRGMRETNPCRSICEC